MKHKEKTNADTSTPESDEQEKQMDINQEELPDAEIEEKDPVSHLEAELTTANDKYLRLYSEFENYKKRVARDRVEHNKMAGADIYSSFLPVLDDFERALKSIVDTTDMDSVKEGVQLIYTKMKNIANSGGLKPMDAVGKPFDPDLHDAIANVPAPNEKMKGKVIEEVEKGYFLNDKVIRHAKVVVGN